MKDNKTLISIILIFPITVFSVKQIMKDNKTLQQIGVAAAVMRYR